MTSEYVFETVRIRHNKAGYLTEHIRRLKDSALFLFGRSPDDSCIRKQVLDFINTRETDYNKKYRLNIFYDKQSVVSLKTAEYYKRTDLLCVNSLAVRKTGERYIKDNTYHKLYSENRHLLGDRYADIILVNEKGHLCECLTSNIFLQKDNILYTPPESSGIFCGIIRKRIIRALKVRTQVLYPDDIMTADKVYLTNSMVGIKRVRTDCRSPHL